MDARKLHIRIYVQAHDGDVNSEDVGNYNGWSGLTELPEVLKLQCTCVLTRHQS